MSTTRPPDPAPARPARSALPAAAFALGLLAALMLLAAGPGTRAGVWDFRAGFTLMKWGAYLGIAAALVAVAALAAARHRRGLALAGLVLALAAVAVPWSLMRGARALPPIHDVTTDTRNPPAFVAVAPLRADAPNPAAYEGEAIAEQQRKAYPDVRPLMLALRPGQAFGEALAAARDMGWEIVAADSAQGRIEASDRTFWFGFVDDVVIRVMPASGITRVDVRSVSRVGKGDVGANANRVREYLGKLRERVPDAVAEE